jgi:hypothetical protein
MLNIIEHIVVSIKWCGVWQAGEFGLFHTIVGGVVCQKMIALWNAYGYFYLQWQWMPVILPEFRPAQNRGKTKAAALLWFRFQCRTYEYKHICLYLWLHFENQSKFDAIR